MSYESIDESTVKDPFNELKTRIFNFAKATSPDIKERIELEKKLKIYLKAPKPELVLNFILECINDKNNNIVNDADSVSVVIASRDTNPRECYKTVCINIQPRTA